MYQIVLAHNSTRGQRPNESQKVVIIDMMKSVSEIAYDRGTKVCLNTGCIRKYYIMKNNFEKNYHFCIADGLENGYRNNIITDYC